VNYYKHHLGDYAKDTRHLSMGEHGAYRLLMDHYYATEKPLPDAQCERIANARTPADRKSVRSVLNQFFTLLNGLWFSSKCESIIAESFSKSQSARKSASARWEANKDMRTHSEGNANAMLATTPLLHKEALSIPNGIEGKTKVSPRSPPIPLEKIIELYHEKLPELPKVEKLTKARAGNIRQRCLEDLKTLDNWGNYFDYVRSSAFLMGLAPATNGRPPFRADIDFLIKPGSFAKIAEEKYHR
jgi:uncharacterized protein YdaU (DUF1376 family)